MDHTFVFLVFYTEMKKYDIFPYRTRTGFQMNRKSELFSSLVTTAGRFNRARCFLSLRGVYFNFNCRHVVFVCSPVSMFV